MKTYYFFLLAGIALSCKNKEPELQEHWVSNPENEEETIYIDTSYKYQQRTGKSGNFIYTYTVSGSDDDGNEVNGSVEMDGEHGSGFITNDIGNQQKIEAKWNGYGILKAVDGEENQYDLKVTE